jgi:ribosome maturation factor RimP
MKGVREMPPRSRAAGQKPATRRSAPTAPPRPAGPSPRQREAIHAVAEPVVAGAGYDLEELTVSRAGRRFLVRVIVDSDRGVSLDAIAEVSRAVSIALDAAEEAGGELLAGEYQLEVSSPGVDRPLTKPRHWRRNRGRLVKVAVAGRQVTGRVMDADETGVVLDSDTARRVPYADLGPGRVQVEFNRPGETAEEDEPTGDLDDIDGVDDDDDDGDFRNMFDEDAFTRDDGVEGRRGNRVGSEGGWESDQSRSAGAFPPAPGSTEGQEREEER